MALRIALAWAVLLGWSAWGAILPAGGQEEAPPANATGGATPLGIRQQRIERMMEELERKFKNLKLSLQKDEPERAERLQQTLDKAKELLLQQRMGEITKLLDEARLDTATDGQKAVLADIRALLELLLDERSDRDRMREEYERLSQWKQELGEILKAERGERRETDRLKDKEGTLAALDAKIKALEAILTEQKNLVNATQEARVAGIQGLGKLAGEQRENRESAEKLANQIAKEAGDERGPYEPKPPREPSPDDPIVLPMEEKPAEGRPAEPGEAPLGAAIKSQQAAENNLQSGKGKSAQQDEEAAVANLERALAELKRETQRIASLPPEAFEKMAKKQDDIAGQTEQLDEKMQEAAQKAESEGGEGGQGKPQPGQKKVAQAQKSMQQASGGLRKQEPADASRQQGKAIQELEEALQEIEERLKQLRDETQIEKLARLEARFREMLSQQQQFTTNTAALDKKRTESNDQLSRSDRNAVRAIGDDERRMEAVRGDAAQAKDAGLAGKAQQALDIIVDDGTSVVFPDVVAQLRDDLIHVGNLLADNLRTDHYTNSLQKEIETSLEELIAALQEAQQQKEGGGMGGGGGSGMEPLLPNSAELKLLRSAQLRINRRTVALDQTRGSDGELEASLTGELETIAERQAEIADMTVQILERAQ